MNGTPSSAQSPLSPTLQSGARATLVRVFGDLMYQLDQPVPTSAFVRLLEDMGFGTHSARQAVARSARIGWITSVKHGRTAWWSLTDMGREFVIDGLERVKGLGFETSSWDGRWMILVISVPHERRVVRQRLYRALTWAGFGSPMPGVWVSVHLDRAYRVSAAVERLELRDTTLSFTGSAHDIGLSEEEMVSRAWNLQALGDTYRGLVEQYSKVASTPLADVDAVRALLDVDAELMTLLSLDPQLPSQLAPSWAGRRDAAQLLEYRTTWSKPSLEYWAALCN
jgi:phenylacetic acid degradation operon negative regulatory protein